MIEIKKADNGIECVYQDGRHVANWNDVGGLSAERVVGAMANAIDTMRGVATMLEDYGDGRDPASNDYIAVVNLRAAILALGGAP